MDIGGLPVQGPPRNRPRFSDAGENFKEQGTPVALLLMGAWQAAEFDGERNRRKDTTAGLQDELRVLATKVMEQPNNTRGGVRGSTSGGA